MTNPKEIFKQIDVHPDELNLEGKQNLVMELVEFMSEGQLDNIIQGMKTKYKCKEVE